MGETPKPTGHRPLVSGQALTLLALALGSFSIGTTAFASMGIIQLFARDLSISLSEATWAISAYALGVVIGAPMITILAARLNRRTVLLALLMLFIAGSTLSSIAPGLPALLVARFLSGLPHGAYFGAASVVAAWVVGPGHEGKAFAIVMTGLTVATIVGAPAATAIGQAWGWRQAYAAIGLLAVVAFAAIYLRVPKSASLAGKPISVKLTALRNLALWGMMLVAATGISSIFAVYTLVAPLVTTNGRLDASYIPAALAVFGGGMTIGNLIGGFAADHHPTRGITLGFGAALVTLALLALFGWNPVVLFVAFFGVGASLMAVIPTIQVRLMRFSPEAPALMGALNIAALNVANGLGAWVAGAVVTAGLGYLASAWAGFLLTAIGLTVFLVFMVRPCRHAEGKAQVV